MNVYVFAGTNGAHGIAVVYAHNATEARSILSKEDIPSKAGGDLRLAKSVFMERNPKAQIITDYFE